MLSLRSTLGLRFPWFLSSIFVLCGALLIAQMLSSTVNMRNLQRSSGAVTENIGILRELESFRAKFLGAQAGYRGYLITRDTAMLQPYHRFISDYGEEMGRLAAKASDTEVESRHAQALDRLVQGRLKEMAAQIELRQKQPPEAAAPAFPADESKLPEEIEATLNAMVVLESRELDAKRAEAAKTSDYGLVFTLVSGILGIAGLCAFYLLTRKYFFSQTVTESALRQRDVEFRALSDMAAVGIVECAVDTGGILRANSKLSALFGYPASELEQMSFFQLLDPATVSEDREAFRRQLSAGATGRWVVERRCLRRDGKPVWVRASFGVIPASSATQEGGRRVAVGIIEDIDERKRIEQNMQDNAAILRAIAEDTRDLICVKDVDGRLLMANQSFLDFIGKPREEVLGHSEIDFLEDPAQAKRARDLDRRIMKERATEYVEEEVTVGGNTHVFLSTKVPYTSQDGGVIGVVSISRDITERKRAEKELLHSRDRLASDVHDRNQQLASLSRHLIHVSEEEKGKLARELHDELGSALAAISMDMGWVLNHIRKSNPEVAARQERALQGVRETLDLKRRLVDGLRPLTLEHFGFEFALRAHCDAFAESAHIKVEVRTPELLPVLGHGTGLALYRMVQECLTNVAKHAHASRVRVSVEVGEEVLLVRVEDDGRGLPHAVAQSPESYGLVSMRERVAAVGGKLSIGNSMELKGVMIEAAIPLSKDDDKSDGATPETPMPEVENS